MVEQAVRKNGRGSLGFEEQLWQSADQLRGNMDAAVYKHVVLGLIFLKYISDAFQQRREEIAAEYPELVEDRDEYRAEGVFWVPQEARWDFIQARARQDTIKQTIDAGMDAIERENPSLKGVLPKQFTSPDLDARRLGNVTDLITNIDGTRYGDRVRKVAHANVECDRILRAIAETVRWQVPKGNRIAVIDKYDPTILRLSRRRGWHFPDRHLLPDGYPRDSDAVVAHLEQLRRWGARFLVVPSSAFWWLDHYCGFAKHLSTRYSRVWNDQHCVIYLLA